VAHRHPQPRLVGELLQRPLPQPVAAAVAAAAVGDHQQLPRPRVAGLAQVLPPLPQGGHGELRRVVVDPDTHPADVLGHVIDPVGDRLAQGRVREIVDPHRLGFVSRLPLAAPGLEIPDQFLLLGVHRDHRLAAALERPSARGDVLELTIAVGVLRPFAGLARRLQVVVQVMQQLGHLASADGVPLVTQRRRQLGGALARPAQGRLGIAAGHRVDQPLQVASQGRVGCCQRPAATSGAPHPARPQRFLGVALLPPQLLDAGPHGHAGEAGGLGHARNPAAAQGQRFGGRPGAPLALIQQRLQPFILHPQLRGGVHAAVREQLSSTGNLDRALILSSAPAPPSSVLLGVGGLGLIGLLAWFHRHRPALSA
jgi:hypothetical protein